MVMGNLRNLLFILCIKCFSIDLIDNHFMYVFNIFADIVNIDFKINRLDANASYVEIKSIDKLQVL